MLSIVYRVGPDNLRIEMRVRNMGDVPFPFGVGLHPYFRFPCKDPDISRYMLDMPARSVWPLIDNLPTGERGPVPDELNFNRPKMIGRLQLDTVYTDLGSIESQDNGMLLRATLSHTELPGRLELWTSPDFRETVVFTPPHRNAVCLEPYTCVTDAINLHSGTNPGWTELPVGGHWAGVVEFRWNGSE
jgi:aldose 1-epimerase